MQGFTQAHDMSLDIDVIYVINTNLQEIIKVLKGVSLDATINLKDNRVIKIEVYKENRHLIYTYWYGKKDFNSEKLGKRK